MPSTKQESQSSRKPSTYERVAEKLDDRRVLIQLWRYLCQREYATQKAIIDSDHPNAKRYSNRGTLSTYLGEMEDEGIVERISQEGHHEPDRWFVPEDYLPEPEKVVEERTVIETETVVETEPRFETFPEWLQGHAILLGPLAFILLFGASAWCLENIYFGYQLGSWPETILFGSTLSLVSALAVGIKEVRY